MYISISISETGDNLETIRPLINAQIGQSLTIIFALYKDKSKTIPWDLTDYEVSFAAKENINDTTNAMSFDNSNTAWSKEELSSGILQLRLKAADLVVNKSLVAQFVASKALTETVLKSDLIVFDIAKSVI